MDRFLVIFYFLKYEFKLNSQHKYELILIIFCLIKLYQNRIHYQ